VPLRAIKSRSVCGLPVVSLPAQGLVGLLWASARYGLAPRTLSQVPQAEAEVHSQLAPVVDRVRSGGFYRAGPGVVTEGEEVSGACTARRAQIG
jgi:hypothetical protein